MTVNNISQLIYFHRKQAKLSRKDLADLAGIGKTVIYDLEHGKETIKWSTVKAILNVLNITIEFESPIMEDYEKSINTDT